MIAGAAACVTLIGLAGFHFYLTANNLTTLESHKNKRYNVFDLKNSTKNFQLLFGKRKLGYILPVQTGYGSNGVVYPIRIRKKEGEIIIIERD